MITVVTCSQDEVEEVHSVWLDTLAHGTIIDQLLELCRHSLAEENFPGLLFDDALGVHDES